MERNSAYMYAFVCMRMCICMRINNYTYLDNCIYSTYACLCVLHVDAYVLYVICICIVCTCMCTFGIRRRMMRTVNCRIGRISTSGAAFHLQDRLASSRPNFVFKAEFRLRGRISSSGPNFVFAAEFRLQGRISSSRPNFVFRAEFRLRGRISSSGPNFVFKAEFRLRGRISSSGPNFVFAAEFRFQGRISSSRPNFVFRAEFRLQGRISSSGPNFVFAAEFRLRGRISSSAPNFVFRAEFRQGRISSSGPNFVFAAEFRLQAPISSSGPIFVFAPEFRLHRAPNRISSSREFRLHGRFSSSNFVFAHNLSFSSLGTISSSKASEFRLQGGYETGTHFPGSMHVCICVCLYVCMYHLRDTSQHKRIPISGSSLRAVQRCMIHVDISEKRQQQRVENTYMGVSENWGGTLFWGPYIRTLLFRVLY